jgi:serpin B
MKRQALAAPLLTLTLALAPLAAAEKAPPKADTKAVVEGNTQFALALYGKLRGREGNLFCSPFSISTALAMTSAGARGKTLEEMSSTLHLPEQKRLHPALGALLKEVNGAGKKRGYQLSTANALWGQKGHPFLKDFLDLNKAHYGAGLSDLDFAGDTEGARQTINAWVEKQTRDKIKELLKKGAVTGDTRLVLTNAIYFKGDWASQFKKDRTRDEDFRLTAAKVVKVPLMHQKGEFRYHEGPALQVLEMPYVGKDLRMVVLLPRKVDALPALEKDLTPANLSRWLGALRTQEVNVSLPRFKMTWGQDLKSALAELGMTSAFGRGADFSGIDGTRRLYISAVIHKAFVEVNEQGTEAAAATAVVIEPRSARITPDFRADHPFLFLIHDTRSGSVLFLGRVVNPK